MNEPKLKKKESITTKTINKQKKILVVAIISLITLFLSSSYALLTNFDKTDNVVTFQTGNLNMSVNNTDGLINLENSIPESDANGLANATAIPITLTNTGNINIGQYDVKLIQDTDNTSTLSDSYIKYAISTDSGSTYQTASLLTNNFSIIYTGYDLAPNASQTIYLKIWVDESAGNNAINKSYYGSVKVELYQSEPFAASKIKAKLGYDGLVAINTDGGLYTGEGEIREYRYSGLNVNNYIYFNCKDNDGTYDYGNENYNYAGNCETWRIVGIFNEDGEQVVKIMRNTMLTDAEVPETYTVNGTSFTIDDGGGMAYWNSTKTGTNYNDWTTAGLQYFLNTESDTNSTAGYLSTLTTNAEELIRTTTYYLGNVEVVYQGSSNDTTITAYTAERDTSNIWEGNQGSWSGKVALLYPSDYGYSADSTHWNTDLYTYNTTAATTSWMQQNANHTTYEWLLSPSSFDSDYAMPWYTTGYGDYSSVSDVSIGVRPVVNLVANAKLIQGNGTSDSPYVVIK